MRSNRIRLIEAVKKILLITSILIFNGCSTNHSHQNSYYTDDPIINQYIQEIEEANNSKVKRDICSRLASLNDPKTVNFFMAALKEMPEIDACAALALGNLDHANTIESLENQIYITNSTGQTILNTPILRALERIGNEETLKFLILINKDFNPTDELGREKKKALEKVIQSLKERLNH